MTSEASCGQLNQTKKSHPAIGMALSFVTDKNLEHPKVAAIQHVIQRHHVRRTAYATDSNKPQGLLPLLYSGEGEGDGLRSRLIGEAASAAGSAIAPSRAFELKTLTLSFSRVQERGPETSSEQGMTSRVQLVDCPYLSNSRRAYRSFFPLAGGWVARFCIASRSFSCCSGVRIFSMSPRSESKIVRSFSRVSGVVLPL